MPRRFFLLPFASAAFVVLSWLHAPCAAAQDAARGKVRLEYQGLAECPDAAAFRAAVGRRLTGEWEAPPGEEARSIDIVVDRVGEGYVATIELLDAEGRRLRRAVRGRDCGDVVNGIALVTALAIESRLDEAVDSSEPVTAAASTPSSAPPAALPSPVAAPPAPTAPPAAATAPAAARATPASAPAVVAPVAPPAPPAEGPLLGWRAGVRAGVASGIAPRVAPGVALAGMLELGAARLGLSLSGFSSGRVVASGVEARFDLLASRLEGCPVTLEVGGPLSLEPCASFEAGLLYARGYSDPPTVEEGQSGRAPWLAPGALLRLVGSFGRVVVELEGVARFPLRHEEFYVESERAGGGAVRAQVHRVPPTSFAAAAGVGLSF